jgi:hypothetical protein
MKWGMTARECLPLRWRGYKLVVWEIVGAIVAVWIGGSVLFLVLCISAGRRTADIEPAELSARGPRRVRALRRRPWTGTAAQAGTAQLPEL